MAPFAVAWRDAPERGMTAPRVVPALDVGKQRKVRVGLGLETASVDQFAFQARDEAFRHRVVVRIPNAARGRAHAHLGATIQLMYDSRYA